MLQAPQPMPGQTGPHRPKPPISNQIGNPKDLPSRPYPATSYITFSRLHDALHLAETAGGVELLDLHLTTRLSGGRMADTFSHGMVRLPSGKVCPFCTTFDRRGFLLLEVERNADLEASTCADIARAVRDGHDAGARRERLARTGRN